MEWIKDAYAKREECLNRWINEYSKAILQTCLYMIPDRVQAEEAVQDTLIKAWRYLGNGKNKKIINERTWLLKIANNTCKDYLRSGWQHHIDQKFSVEESPPKLLRIDPEDRSIRLMVLEMPDKLKKAVLLYYFQGLTQQEIADLLHISISTVNRRLRSGVETLRKALEEECGKDTG